MSPVVAERVVVRVLEAPVDDPVPMSFSRLTARRCCLVEVHTDAGVGVGESWVNYPDWAPAERVATLLDGVAPLLLGEDVSDPRTVLDSLWERLSGVSRQWGAPGPIWQAISAIDLALWDLAGRRAGTPTGSLLGQARPSAPAYASGIGPTRVEELSERALELGIGAIKAKIGFGADTDRATIKGIRAVSPTVRIFADANQAWRPDEAIENARWLADAGVEWLEEPIRGDDPAALARLHQATGMPLATGENIYGLDALRAAAAIPGVAQIQPDPAKSGGLSIPAALAEGLSDCTLSPHWYAGAIGLRAAVTLATALPSAGWVEFDVRANPLRDELLAEGFRLDAGRLTAPEAVGLVGDLDWDRVAAFEVHTAERSTA